MARTPVKLILWTGPRHSGKTTAVEQLVERVRARGFTVAGLLARSIHRNGALTGFEGVDLHTGKRCLLARRDAEGPQRVGMFSLTQRGLQFGGRALTLPTARSADLVVIDEFGPLELRGDGWRPSVDSLVARAKGVILLVVRDDLVDRVRRAYGKGNPLVVSGLSDDAISRVMRLLENDRPNAHSQG